MLLAENVLYNRVMRFAQMGNHTNSTALVTTVPTTITPPDGAVSMLIQATGQNARFVLGGTVSPTTVSGFQLKTTDQPLLLMLEPSQKIILVQEAATATLDYAFGADPS